MDSNGAMKIKAPLAAKEETKPLCDVGADELFCGIEPYKWRRIYRGFQINQRTGRANFTKVSDLEKAISIAHKYNVKVHVTMNAFLYLDEQYEITRQIIKDVLELGADGIVFADPVLMKSIDYNLLKGKDVVVGTDAVIFNSAAVRFYKRLGATRIVFPRSMTLKEMQETLTLDKSLEYEVFIIHDLCFFEDGLCAYCKDQSGGMSRESSAIKGIDFYVSSRIQPRGQGNCRGIFKRQRIMISNNKRIGREAPFSFWMKKNIDGCGVCALHDLNKMGVAAVKVLDRNLPAEEKIKATRFVKNCLGVLGDNRILKKEYVDTCRSLFKKTFKTNCNRYECYYPSVFRWK